MLSERRLRGQRRSLCATRSVGQGVPVRAGAVSRFDVFRLEWPIEVPPSWRVDQFWTMRRGDVGAAPSGELKVDLGTTVVRSPAPVDSPVSQEVSPPLGAAAAQPLTHCSSASATGELNGYGR